MMVLFRYGCCLVVLCLAGPLRAQVLEENLSSESKGLMQDELQYWRSLGQHKSDDLKDSLTSAFLKHQPYVIADSLGRSFKAIPSQKLLQQVKDSLRLPDIDNVPYALPVSREELIDKIRESVYGNSDDKQLKRLKDLEDLKNAQSLKPELEKLPMNQPLPSEDAVGSMFKDSLRQYGASLTKLQLDPLGRSMLPSLPGKVVPKELASLVDSVRLGHLREQKLCLDTVSHYRAMLEMKFKERQSFWEKTYKEFLVGVSTHDFKTFQFAPALAYPLTKRLSLGLGPSLLFQQAGSDVDSKRNYTLTWRARGFVKAQLFNRAYAQVEDTYMPAQRDGVNAANTLLGGGGYLFPLTQKISLNMVVLFRVYSSDPSRNVPPFVFRLGISSLRIKH
ncbi:hypothetical protein [Chryseolinea lacunae]|uniref:Uncharacterized protein n=1 Tax=Chryseolinea lacunae TaxID=2801331 RepID=A0ABS1KZB5_9BACT|nr:hypothetical protein [Chryseolinea lacunae]MBL0744806.1 hypothetical protein [Chryseolinea lacunae]